MKFSIKVYDYLGHPGHKSFIHFDLKYRYWAVEVHPEDRWMLSFTIPGIGQLQPTRMLQGTRTSSFTFEELMLIAFGRITPPQPEPSLLEWGEKGEPPAMAFYLDDGFSAGDSYESHFAILRDHLLPRLSWSKLKLGFNKLQLFCTSVVALGESHQIGGRVYLKEERIAIILKWPIPQDKTGVKAFLGTVGTTRRWVKSFAELARPLNRLTAKVIWRWTNAEDFSFHTLRNLCATKAAMFGWMPGIGVLVYCDASGGAAGCYISQVLSEY